MGRPRDDIVGMHQSALHPPGETVKYKRKFAEHIKIGHAADYDGEVIRKDGTVVPVAISAGTLTVNGRPHILGLFRDITEQVRAQEQLVHRLAIEEAVARASRAFISAEGADLGRVLEILGKAVSVNRAYIFKSTDNLERADNAYEWCSPHTEPQIHDLQGLEAARFPWWTAKLKRGEDIVIPDVDALPPEATPERQFIRAHGVRSLLVVPIHLPDETLGGFMGYDDTEKPRQWAAEDVRALRVVAEMVGSHWDRRRAEEALRDSEEKYRLVSENIPVVVYSALADEHSTNLFVSGRIEGLTGYRGDEFLEDPLLYSRMLHPEDREGVWQAIEEHRREKIPLDVECRIITKDGAVKWIRDVADPMIDEQGNLVRIDGFMEDITERKRAEGALRISHQFLEIANRHATIESLLEHVVQEVQRSTRCAAVGIRVLDEDGNIPYAAYKGFSQDFYESESPLSIKSDQCMCTNVVKGETDPKLPFYTEGGAFYMNGTTRFLATVSEEEKGRTRNVCNQKGYESVALVPIRIQDRILGLIHVADPRENMVPLDIVKGLEDVAVKLAMAIQRLTAEEALRESEEKYRRLFTTETDAVAILDAETRQFLDVNEAAIRLYGHTREEFVKLRFSDIAADPEKCNLVVEQTLTGGPTRVPVGYHKKKDGTVFPVEISSSTFMLKDRRVVCGVVRDLTERERAEEETARLLKAIETAKEAISTVSAEGVMTYTNHAMDELFGYAKGELIAKHVSILNAGATPGAVAKRITDNIARDGYWEGEVHNKRKDGSEFTSHAAISAVRDADGKILDFLSTQHDITDRKLAEDAILREKRLSDSIVDNTPAGIAFLDNDFVLRRCNHVYAELLRIYTPYTPEQALGMSYFDYAPGSRPQVEEWFQKVRDTGQVDARYGFKLVLEGDGQEKTSYWDTSVAVSLDAEGKVDGILILTQDVTDRKRAEEALIESEEKYHQLFNTVPDAIMMFDAETRQFIDVNDAALRLYGYDRAEFLAMKHGDITVEPEASESSIEATRAGRLERIPLRLHKTRDGTTFPVEISASTFILTGRPIMCGVIRDITERERAEEALRVSEQRYRQIVETAEEGIWMIDKEANTTLVNPKMAAMLGYEPGEMEGRHLLDFMDDQAKLAAEEELKRRKRGVTEQHEFRFSRKDGSDLWALLSTNPIVDALGRYSGALAMVTDITQRKRVEDAIRKSEKEKTLILSNTSEIIAYHDKNHVIQWANRAYQKATGLSSDELKGQECYRAWGLERTCNDCPVAMAIRTGKTHQTELSPQNQEDWPADERSWLVRGDPVRDQDGNIIGAIEVSTDITERKRVEQALEQSEAKLTAIMSSMADLVFALNEHGRFTFYGGPPSELFLSPEQFIGKKHSEVMPPHVNDLFSGAFPRIRKGETAEFDYSLEVNGKMRWYSAKLSPMVIDGDFAGAVAVIRNVTERREVEEALRESQTFLSNVFRSIQDGISVLDTEMNIVRANETMEWWYAHAMPLAGKKCYEAYHGRSEPCEMCPALRTLKTGAGAFYVFPRIGRGGNVNGWLDLHTFPLVDAATGEHKGVIEYARDVTERKRVEDALQESEDKHKTLLENLPQRIFLKDKNLVYVSCNEKYARDLGIEPDAIVGKTDYEFYPEALAEKYRADDRRILESGAGEDIEESYVRDGMERWVHTVKTPVKDERGDVHGVLGIFWDVTERRQAAEEVKSLARFPAENVSPVLRISKDGTLMYANAAAEPLLAELEAKAGELVATRWRQEIEGVFAGRRSKDIHVAAEGRTFSLILTPIPDTHYLNVYGRDITERRRAEGSLQRSREQLRRLAAHLQSAREEERAHLAREIHDRVGHELTALKMDLTQFEKGLPDTTLANPELREQLETIGNALDKTVRLVGGIAAGLRPGLLDDFGIVAAIEWEAEQFRKRAGIRCQFQPPPEEVELDRERATAVFRICQEMLSNVARHAQASSADMSLQRDGGEVVLIVRDNGRGVTEDDINSSRSLGILGMRERALAFGGQVHIQGTAGRGTTVTARIPLDEER